MFLLTLSLMLGNKIPDSHSDSVPRRCSPAAFVQCRPTDVTQLWTHWDVYGTRGNPILLEGLYFLGVVLIYKVHASLFSYLNVVRYKSSIIGTVNVGQIMENQCKFVRNKSHWVNPDSQLLHGFDDTGRLYAPDGAKRVWWPQTVREDFDSRARCFVRQYSTEVRGLWLFGCQ